ncbi:hypothetical protein [Pedobacter steynii]|nr:hypothetical protein [Pedobacter steynii]
MKKTLSLIALVLSVFTFSTVMAETESAGGGSGGTCEAPFSNTCYKIVINGVTTTKTGVLHVRP